MRYIVLVDEKPKKCEDCFYYVQDLVPLNDNTFDLQYKCSLNGEYKKCPLTVMNAIFTTDEDEGEEENVSR